MKKYCFLVLLGDIDHQCKHCFFPIIVWLLFFFFFFLSVCFFVAIVIICFVIFLFHYFYNDDFLFTYHKHILTCWNSIKYSEGIQNQNQENINARKRKRKLERVRQTFSFYSSFFFLLINFPTLFFQCTRSQTSLNQILQVFCIVKMYF